MTTQTQTQVLIIGGGVVGCSVFYHLLDAGWRDVTLIERAALTSGSTWHAAGGFHTLNADTNIAALQSYTIELYRRLEKISGQSCGLHHVGGLTLAATPERMDFLRATRAKHRHMNLDTHLVTPQEIAELSPITDTQGLIGALYDPLDGHLDPAGTTHAYAAAAKKLGGKILLNRPVTALSRTNEGWRATTQDGDIIAEHIINAAGLWAREVGAMAGVNLPLQPMQHQYLVTDDIPAVFERAEELPHVMDPEGENYLRQEGRGLVIGFYEKQCEAWAVDGTPADFGHELLPDDLSRIGDSLAHATRRYPPLADAGIKKIINGPFTFAPDGNPLVGPTPGLKNYWVACGVMAGFSQAGGVGLTLAEWMTEGEPARDVFAMDVARFGDYCTRDYARVKVMENYRRRFSVAYPNEELPAGRPLHTTPMYAIWQRQNAVFGANYGMEHVNYFAAKGEPAYETPSFRRSNAFPAVARECRAVREAIGINEIHNFSKFEVKGKGARDWLRRVMAGRVPPPGQVSLSPMLSPRGRLIGDFTISALSEDEFQLTASYVAQAFHLRWFEAHAQPGVTIRNLSRERLGFQIAGPNSRELLSRVCAADVSNAALKFFHVARLRVGDCDAIVQRLSYTGDLGYEIYAPAEKQTALYAALARAGESLNLTAFGMRAIMSLRLEKSFGAWLREYKPDFTPQETGMDKFMDPQRDFIGKAAARAKPARKLCTLVVAADDADADADEPVWCEDKVIGFVTSGGYAHYSQAGIAMAMLPADLPDNAELSVEILGERRQAKRINAPLFDPSGARMRG